MKMYRKSFILLLFVGLTAVAKGTVSSEGSEVKSKQENGTDTASGEQTVVAQLQKEDNNNSDEVSKNKFSKKSRECILQAFKVVIMDSKSALSAECRSLLLTLRMKSLTGKEKEEPNIGAESDLKRELKELTENDRYKGMNDEIGQAEQDLLSEKREVETADLEEIKNTRKDNEALSELENEKVATSMRHLEQIPPYVHHEREIKSQMNDGVTKYMMGNSGVGLLENGNRGDVDEEFLVIPLRYIKEKYKEQYGPSRMAGDEPINVNKAARDKIEDDDTKWSLRSIFDHALEEKNDKKKFGSKRISYGFGNKKEADNTHQETRDAGNFDGSLYRNTENEIDEVDDGSMREKGRIPHPQESNRDDMNILAQVENDISKLDQDLRIFKSRTA